MILALFFTRGISLREWVDIGIFQREKLLYEEHLRSGVLSRVVWFTYGNDDVDMLEALKEKGEIDPRISVVAMPSLFKGKIGCFIYSILIPFLQWSHLKDVHVLKTNQIDGSWSAVIASKLFGKPLIVRTGYTVSQQERDINSQNKLAILRYKIIEKFAYNNCNVAFVSSYHSKKYLTECLSVDPEILKVVPNYIQTQLFFPKTDVKRSERLLYVGRLSHKKNLYHLIAAAQQLNKGLDIYGNGELGGDLRRYVNEMSADVRFMGTVPNNELPFILNSYSYYVLPSLQEGMPKTLLEAMACGLVCIGTNVDGINEIIIDGYNGYLSKGPSCDDLAYVISRAIQGDNDQIRMHAVCTIEGKYSLDLITKVEAETLSVLVEK